METLRYTVEEAERYLDEGSLGVAELIAFAALIQSPQNPRLWSVLAKLAEAIGQPDRAARYSLAAKALDLGSDLPRAEPWPGPVGGPPAPSADRYLLIKAWGYGFCSDVDHVLGCLLLAEMTGRTPVTWWGDNSLFRDQPGEDAWRLYFEPLSDVKAQDLIGQGHDFWPPKWNDGNLLKDPVDKHDGPYARLSALHFLNRPERVLVSDYHTGVSILTRWLRPGHPAFGMTTEGVIRYLVAKYLRPVAEVREQVEAFAAKHFGSGQVIGVHVRGTDKFLEDPEHAQRMGMIPGAVDHLAGGDKSARIFLMTDSTQVVQMYQKRYGPRLVMTEAYRTNTRVGLPFLGTRDKKRLGIDVMRDIYLAARCHKFVGLGSSNVANLIYHLKDWPAGSTVILGPMMMHMQEPSQFMSVEQLKRYFPPEQVDKWRKDWK